LTHYAKLRRLGRGPDLMHIGGATRISAEAAARWRRSFERQPLNSERGKAAVAAKRQARAAGITPDQTPAG
jgi:hypothetical protein